VQKNQARRFGSIKALAAVSSSLKILVTAFEPYDQWSENSSWEALAEMLKEHGLPEGVTTRRYPVDLEKLKERLFKDLESGFDAVLHLGQSPGASAIHLETIAVNIAGVTYNGGKLWGPLDEDGPTAYQTQMPLDLFREELLNERIPASITYHAGTYLCNAVFYLTQHWNASRRKHCQVGFVHFPLMTEQVVEYRREMPSLTKSELAKAIHIMLNALRSQTATPGDALIA
jgi:pyroglutamyl-peptidase